MASAFIDQAQTVWDDTCRQSAQDELNMRENAELWRLQSRMNNLANRQMSEQLSRSFSGIGPLAGAGYGRLGSVGGLGLGYGAGLCPYGLGMGGLGLSGAYGLGPGLAGSPLAYGGLAGAYPPLAGGYLNPLMRSRLFL